MFRPGGTGKLTQKQMKEKMRAMLQKTKIGDSMT